MATAANAKARQKPCAQRELCSMGEKCPFDYNIQRCWNDAMDDLELDEEIERGTG